MLQHVIADSFHPPKYEYADTKCVRNDEMVRASIRSMAVDGWDHYDTIIIELSEPQSANPLNTVPGWWLFYRREIQAQEVKT